MMKLFFYFPAPCAELPTPTTGSKVCNSASSECTITCNPGSYFYSNPTEGAEFVYTCNADDALDARWKTTSATAPSVNGIIGSCVGKSTNIVT